MNKQEKVFSNSQLFAEAQVPTDALPYRSLKAPVLSILEAITLKDQHQLDNFFCVVGRMTDFSWQYSKGRWEQFPRPRKMLLSHKEVTYPI